uniref:Uncharacterized protein n=1 Tax=Schizaphis graminum TaxID=13262 RepID=A0A2S2NR72_SCHGA
MTGQNEPTTNSMTATPPHKYQRLYTLSQHLPSPQQYCSRVHSPDLHIDADAVPTSNSSNITSDNLNAAVAVATVTATACCCTSGDGETVISTGPQNDGDDKNEYNNSDNENNNSDNKNNNSGDCDDSWRCGAASDAKQSAEQHDGTRS